MKKPISPRVHGFIDYTTVAAVAAAPRVMNFPKPARMLADTLVASYSGVSAMTDYPLGVKRAIPFRAHGVTELAIAAILPVLPWALGFADNKAARNFFFGLTALTLTVSALTNWDTKR